MPNPNPDYFVISKEQLRVIRGGLGSILAGELNFKLYLPDDRISLWEAVIEDARIGYNMATEFLGGEKV